MSVTVSTFLIFMFVDQLLLVFVDQLLLNFDGAETLGEILESEGKQRFVRLFVVNDCGWRDFASSRIISRRLGLDNCVRYRFNRPRLYLTEEHSIRWKFCLVNHKLFHLICSASNNQSVRTHLRRNKYSKIKEN